MVSVQKQKVIIVGHSSTLRLGLVRSVAELGCEVTVIVMTAFWPFTKKLKTLKPFDCYSKYISHVYYCHANEGDCLIRLLLDKCKDIEQKAIIIPCSDFTALTLDNNKDLLSGYFLFPHINDSSKSVQYWMDKENQKDLARSVGLNVPESHIVDIKCGEYDIPHGINYPCFTKSLVSVNGGKEYFRRCNTEDELSEILSLIGRSQDTHVLVEDYKEIEAEYAVLGFANGEDVIIPGLIRIKRQTSSHFGVAMTGDAGPINGFEAIIERFKSFVLRMGFVGIFDIDFYYSDNTYYFGEMNLRFGGSGYAFTKMGVNLPAMLIRYLRGEDFHGMKMQIDKTLSYVNERMCEDDWCAGAITDTEYRKIVASVDISFVKDESDPLPQKIFNTVHRLLPIKRIAKKILK